MSKVGRQQKNQQGKGMFGAAALTFPFQNIEIGKMDIGMEKKVEKGYPKQSCESGKKGLCHIF